MEVRNTPNLLSNQQAQQARKADIAREPEIQFNNTPNQTPVERSNQSYVLSISQPLTMREQQQTPGNSNTNPNSPTSLYQQIQNL